MLGKLSIRERFIGVALSFAFLALISIVAAVGYVGLTSMALLHADSQLTAQNEWVDVRLATAALAYSNRNSRLNVEIVVSHNSQDIASLLAERRQNSAKISNVLMQLGTRVSSEKEQQLLNAVVEARRAYLASYERVTDLVVQKHAQQARRLLVQEASPLLLKYHLAWEDFIQFQMLEMDRQLEKTTARYAANRNRTVGLIALAILLAIAIAQFAVRKIIIEVHQREQAEHELRQLNEQLELKILQRTAALEKSNRDLGIEVAERKQVEEKLRSETAFLEAQANSTLDGILVVDNQNRKILQNRRFKEIFHLPKEVIEDDDDATALSFVLSQVVNPEQFLQKVRHLYDHPNETTRDEIEFKNGTVLDRYSAPVIEQDRYFGRIWVFRDITERKQNEELVRRLSLAVEQSPVSVIITDLKGRITYVNRKFVECTGYHYEEVLGKSPRILKSGYTPPEEYKRLWETSRSGSEWRGEFRNRKKNGELYWESAVIRPIRDEKGAISHFLALKEDITERRNIEERLWRAQKLESIGQLAAGIAHEINTPMQFIGDNLRFMQQNWGSVSGLISVGCLLHELPRGESAIAQAADRLTAIPSVDLKFLQEEIPTAIEESLDGVKRVSQIVQAMKRFSHSDSGERELTNINEAIETTITVARGEWKHVAEIEMTLSEDLGLIPCYVGEFNQVILNLIVNAAHAIGQLAKAPDGKGKITVRTSREQNWAQITIQDTGGGIPPAVRSRVFEPFFTTKEVGKGTGQGLAIAHAVIVKRHGGSIWFETEEGRGTTFYVRIPAV